MRTTRSPVLSLAVALILSACAARRYQPAPIDPTDAAMRLESRNLNDPGLQAFVEKTAGHAVAPWPPKTWDLGTISVAALYFNPALEAARARFEEAQAAVVTAGARPNPKLNIAPGVPSPYLLNLEFAVPLETGGKRGHRIEFAQSLDQAARLDLANSAWKIRSGVRAAFLNYLLASRSADLLYSEEAVRNEQVAILAKRFSVGEIPRPDVDLARIELSKAHLAISTGEGRLGEAKAALAASIGIPEHALQDVSFSWSDFDSPPSLESLTPQQITRDAVINRLDVRRSLARYAASEADLQLEIAKQYPDIEIGPGYQLEERNSFFTLGLSTILPVFNRNQGPIAEAEARRKEAASVFLETQAQVIAESEAALARYAAALKELVEADESLRKLQITQQQAMQKAVRVGEEDQLALNAVLIETSVVTRTRLDVLSRAQVALGALEDVVQRPLTPGDAFSINPDSPALDKLPKESKR